MIAVGDYIWIEYIENNEPKKARSKAVSVENGELHISYPVDLDSGRTVFLHKGLEITAEFMGNGHVPYQFKSIIKGKKKDPIPMIGLDIPPSGGNEADSKTPIRPCRRSIGCIRQNGSEKNRFPNGFL